MDAEDRALKALFAHPPLADEGFSERVVRRIRRQALLRRAILPTAIAAGLLLSAGPLLQLIGDVLAALQSVLGSLGAVPQQAAAGAGSGMLYAIALLGVVSLGVRMLED